MGRNKSYCQRNGSVKSQNVSAHIQNIADCFGKNINHEVVETVRFSLNAYTKFLLLYRKDSGEYIEGLVQNYCNSLYKMR